MSHRTHVEGETKGVTPYQVLGCEGAERQSSKTIIHKGGMQREGSGRCLGEQGHGQASALWGRTAHGPRRKRGGVVYLDYSTLGNDEWETKKKNESEQRQREERRSDKTEKRKDIQILKGSCEAQRNLSQTQLVM